jgi:3-dehydroquinate dehydratase-1
MTIMKFKTLNSRKPAITAVILDRIDKRTVVKALAQGANVLELRVDTFGKRSPESIVRGIKRLRGYEGAENTPLILTCRARSEGGVQDISLKEKALIFTALMSYVDYIDIELRKASRFSGVIASAKKAGTGVIISYHDFKGTPRAPRLEALIQQGKALGGDIVKIAATANSARELKRLAALLIMEHKGLIVIAMGPMGAASRIFFPLLGSLATYGSVTRSAAPGQLPVAELAEAFRKYGIGG